MPYHYTEINLPQALQRHDQSLRATDLVNPENEIQPINSTTCTIAELVELF